MGGKRKRPQIKAAERSREVANVVQALARNHQEFYTVDELAEILRMNPSKVHFSIKQLQLSKEVRSMSPSNADESTAYRLTRLGPTAQELEQQLQGPGVPTRRRQRRR
jgi:DNA-directed RNA polymerase specialized sigma subunit